MKATVLNLEPKVNYLLPNQPSKEDYKACIKSIHTATVEKTLLSYAPNKVLQGAPPKVCESERLLGRNVRTTLSQLCSGTKTGWTTSQTSVPHAPSHPLTPCTCSTAERTPPAWQTFGQTPQQRLSSYVSTIKGTWLSDNSPFRKATTTTWHCCKFVRVLNCSLRLFLIENPLRRCGQIFPRCAEYHDWSCQGCWRKFVCGVKDWTDLLIASWLRQPLLCCLGILWLVWWIVWWIHKMPQLLCLGLLLPIHRFR